MDCLHCHKHCAHRLSQFGIVKRVRLIGIGEAPLPITERLDPRFDDLSSDSIANFHRHYGTARLRAPPGTIDPTAPTQAAELDGPQHGAVVALPLAEIAAGSRLPQPVRPLRRRAFQAAR